MSGPAATPEPFIRTVKLRREEIPDVGAYPFSIPAIGSLDALELHPRITYFVGENGTGKSTLLEAIAIASGMNPEGGSRNMRFTHRPSESNLAEVVSLVRGARRPRTDYFLRAESLFNVATEVDRLAEGDDDFLEAYGGASLHEQSHGESFLALAMNRFGRDGLYLLDEPEAALSVPSSLALLRRMHELIETGSQFIVATHSPTLMAYPEATIYRFDESGVSAVAYDESDPVSLFRHFLADPGEFLHHLLADG